MNKTSYHDRIVHKPWGYEYTIFKNSNKLAATFVKINYNQKTSLHCHPNKKTSFIILQGNALVQLGIYKSNCKKYTAPSRLVIRPGLFHSIKSISKKGLIALEFEKPAIKKDLLRYKDDYGRANMPYESFKNTSIINNKLLFFKKPKNKKRFKEELEVTQMFERLESFSIVKETKKTTDVHYSVITCSIKCFCLILHSFAFGWIGDTMLLQMFPCLGINK